MAKQEITIQGIDGQLDELILTTNDETSNDKLEDCARLLFPQEGETIPRLRFKGFEGDWTEATLGELFMERNESNINGEMLSVTMNNGIIKASDNGRFDNSNSDKSHYKVVKVNDIAYNSMRMWQGASGCSAYEGIVSPAYTVVTPVDGIDPNFFACLFKTPAIIKKFRLHSQGLTSDTWNLKYPAFSKISVLYPKDIKEQRLIASFFKRLDSQLLLHQQQFERLRQLKSACLDSMFPQQSENTPPIRFKGYNEKWKVVLLSDCLMVNKERNQNAKYGKSEVLSVSDDYGVVNQIEYLGRSFAGKSVINYRVLKHGDIVYTKSPLKVKPFGIIKVNEGESGIVSTLYAVYTPKEGVSARFINYYFAPSHRMNTYIHPLVNKGAKNDMKVTDENVLKGTISIPPTYEEQEQIASFFHELEERISINEQRLERLKEMKIACLNNMFPQNGGGILPIIRFKGFNGAWITKSFTEIFVFLKNNSLSRADLDIAGTVMNVHYGDILVKFGDLIDMNKETLPYIKNEPLATTLAESCRLQNGDIVFADAAEDNTVGKCAEIMSVDNKYVVSGLHTIPCRPETGMFADGFLGYCLNAPSFHDQLLPLIQGTKISSISKKALSGTFITYPSDINEQNRIASFFRSLDTKILLQTQRIEKLKQMKAACLNKMIA